MLLGCGGLAGLAIIGEHSSRVRAGLPECHIQRNSDHGGPHGPGDHAHPDTRILPHQHGREETGNQCDGFGIHLGELTHHLRDRDVVPLHSAGTGRDGEGDSLRGDPGLLDRNSAARHARHPRLALHNGRVGGLLLRLRHRRVSLLPRRQHRQSCSRHSLPDGGVVDTRNTILPGNERQG